MPQDSCAVKVMIETSIACRMKKGESVLVAFGQTHMTLHDQISHCLDFKKGYKDSNWHSGTGYGGLIVGE